MIGSPLVHRYREGRGIRLTARAPKGEETEAKPGAKHTSGKAEPKQTQATRDTLTYDKLQAHPHRSAKATVQQATADNLKPQWRPLIHGDREGRGTLLTAWTPKGEEPRPTASPTRHTHTRHVPDTPTQVRPLIHC
jgi:hypothetical protein